VLALAACGGASRRAPLAAGDARALRADVTAVSNAVSDHARARALRAASALHGRIETLRRAGRISATDAGELLAVAARLAGQIDAALPAPTPTAPTTPTTATTATTATATATAPTVAHGGAKPPEPAAPPESKAHGHGPGAPPGHAEHGHGGPKGGDGGD
jgi:hypothetical protein